MSIDPVQVFNIVADHACVGDSQEGYARVEGQSLAFPFGAWGLVHRLEENARRQNKRGIEDAAQRFLTSICKMVEPRPPLRAGQQLRCSPSASDQLVEYLKSLPR